MSSRMPDTVNWEIHDAVPDLAGRVVDHGIGQFNEAAAPLHEVRALSCFAVLPAGAVIGGAVGRTWGACCELQQLWVQASHRRAGIGTGLMMRFEARAQEHGCRTFYLETFSFQAPGFYLGLGYGEHARIEGFPGGMIKHLMIKRVQEPRTGRQGTGPVAVLAWKVSR
jgi:GNAT superfamily N-acetyltransferase